MKAQSVATGIILFICGAGLSLSAAGSTQSHREVAASRTVRLLRFAAVGRISGRLLDQHGTSVSGADVLAKNIVSDEAFKDISADDGTFIVAPLVPGVYQLTITKEGFKSRIIDDVKVEGTKPASLQVTLEPEGVSAAKDEGRADQQQKQDSKAEKSEDEKPDHRLLQSNGLLVDTAYHQEDGEVQHALTFSRSPKDGWASVISQEWPIFSEKHQVSLSLPANLFVRRPDGNRGVGDLTLEYSYFLIGSNESRVTVSPGAGFSLPTGSVAKGLGAGGPGASVKLPISVMLTRRFASNSTVELSYVSSAKNTESDQFHLWTYEVGQSFVWFARPKLNVLMEAVWERSRFTNREGFKEIDREVFISPGVRWAHVFHNGLTIIPGVAVPIGVGSSRGDHRIFFYLAIEHPFKRRH